MRFKISYKKIVLLSVVFIVISLLLVNYTFSALTSRKSNELRIAYANGYYKGVKLSIDKIKELQKNDELLKQEIMLAADEYLIILSEMNE